jgi:RNA polymerase-binding transcription factor
MAVKKTSAVRTEKDAAAPSRQNAAASAKKAPAKKGGAASTASSKGRPSKLAVRSGESPWTAREIAEVRAALESDAVRLQTEITDAEEEIAALMRAGGEGAGHDQADVGSNTFERDHEMTLARNARENLDLVQQALARIDNGTYGVCESCGQGVGKARLQAFPRATLCMECKQRQERR